MTQINYQALREVAEKATPGNWWIDSHGQAMVSFIDNEVLDVFVTDNKRDAVRHEDTGNLSRWRNDNDATFIATADPATVLALLDELESAEKRIAELEALTTPRLTQPAVNECAISCPAEAIRACMEEFPESVRDIVEECASIAENACRAAMLQGDEPVTDNTSQQFESLSRGDK